MKTPKRTGEIFELLSKGGFICSNSSQDHIRQLYDIIDADGNYDILYDYFLAIHFVLEKGNEYYYFSRHEQKADMERKIEAAFKWIDWLDFFKTYDSAFGVGYSFTASEIMVRIQVDASLKNKLEALRKNKEEPLPTTVERLIKALVSDDFAEMENEILASYKVLASFDYLENLIRSIYIPEAVQHEIPE
jgi:hypothetical protein